MPTKLSYGTVLLALVCLAHLPTTPSAAVTDKDAAAFAKVSGVRTLQSQPPSCASSAMLPSLDRLQL
jgi:hypothetical protein